MIFSRASLQARVIAEPHDVDWDAFGFALLQQPTTTSFPDWLDYDHIAFVNDVLWVLDQPCGDILVVSDSKILDWPTNIDRLSFPGQTSERILKALPPLPDYATIILWRPHADELSSDPVRQDVYFDRLISRLATHTQQIAILPTNAAVSHEDRRDSIHLTEAGFRSVSEYLALQGVEAPTFEGYVYYRENPALFDAVVELQRRRAKTSA